MQSISTDVLLGSPRSLVCRCEVPCLRDYPHSIREFLSERPLCTADTGEISSAPDSEETAGALVSELGAILIGSAALGNSPEPILLDKECDIWA